MGPDALSEEATEPAFKPLTMDELKAIVASEIKDSLGALGSGSEVASSRIRAMRLYYGRKLGNEVPGRSQVVMTDVADTIHWIMPSLMRMFDVDELFTFTSLTEKGVEAAKQATDVINAEFWGRMNGFDVLYDWLFTGLLENTGIVLPYWDEKIEPAYETWIGLTPGEYQKLVNDPTREVQIVQLEEREVDFQGQKLTVYDCVAMEVRRVGRIEIKGIAPENFLISKRASRCDDRVDFVGERSRMTASDLIAMGFDPEEVKRLPAGEGRPLTLETIERERREQQLGDHWKTRGDEAMKEHWVNNVWIRVDQDGDGFAELRHLLVVGDQVSEILENDYARFQPFCTWTPVPIPFRFVGQGMADLVGDLQLIRSTLMRQILDNAYLTNTPRTKVLEGAVEINDLLTGRVGGMVRVQSMDALEQMDQPPLPRESFMLLDKLDEVRQIRTGVQPAGMGAGADARNLQATATGSNSAERAANARVEMIGRVFAKSGLKRLGEMLLRLYKQNDNKARTMQIRGAWVEIDPSGWPDDLTVSVNPGLGVGAAAERIAMLMSVLTLQKEAVMTGASFMVAPKNIYAASRELTKAMGFRGPDQFFANPGDQAWPPAPPNPKILEHQRRALEDQNRADLDRRRLEADEREKERMNDFRLQELATNERIAREQNETQIEVAQISANARGARSAEAAE